MSTFKKTKVVMLPTNEKAEIGTNVIVKHNTTLAYGKKVQEPYNLAETEQHLYFLSDEEIKVGDWYIHNQKGTGLRVQQCVGTNLPMDSKKIIATTDTSLRLTEIVKEDDSIEFPYITSLPQPSQPFIEKFVEEYNKGNVITEVMVEYESIGAYANPKYDSDYQLKINPRDNTITIRKAKDSWSREEVKIMIEKAICERDQFLNKSGTLSYSFDKWIEENL